MRPGTRRSIIFAVLCILIGLLSPILVALFFDGEVRTGILVSSGISGVLIGVLAALMVRNERK